MSLINAVFGLFLMSLCITVLSVAGYWYIKKHVKSIKPGYQDREVATPSHEAFHGGAHIEQAIKDDWLKIVEDQQVLCAELIDLKKTAEESADLSLLLCWDTFLKIEYEILNKGVPCLDIDPYLEAFQVLADKVDKAFEVETLQKSLQELEKTLEAVKKVNVSVSDELCQSKEESDQLRGSFNELQALRKQEETLDINLEAVKFEIARILSLQQRVQQRMGLTHNPDLIEANANLESFIHSMSSPNVLAEMGYGVIKAVSDLKKISNEQLKTIHALQKENKQMKSDVISQRIQLSNDVLIVRLENIFSDRNRSVKELERKLDSLHKVRYNLNVDLLKTEEVLHSKDKVLKGCGNSTNVIADMKGLIESKYKSMQVMQDLLHSTPLTIESDAYTSEQSERLGELKAMVLESELYVEMLEKNLVSAKEEKEALSALLNKKVDDLSDQPIEAKQRYLSSQEVHSALEIEWLQLKVSLDKNVSMINGMQNMSSGIESMSQKVSSVTHDYTELEKKYLALAGSTN